MTENEDVTFTITCTMKMRWARQFLGMLKTMQRLGSWGSSRNVTFFADGDGDYRPKFHFDVPKGGDIAEGEEDKSGNMFFDAG